jgi:hypothetical protein
MKNIVFITLLITTILSLQGTLSAQEDMCGVVLGDMLLKPGEKAVIAFSNLGFPEQMWAMRGRGEKSTDYIKFDYVDHGITLDITNDDNILRAIIVRKKGLKLKGVPFDVGQSWNKVKEMWGEPDKKEAGYANFFKKGVMVKVTDTGIIELIVIYKPGKIDYDEMKHKG